MSIQEKRSIVSMISNLLIFGIYYTIVFGIYSENIFTTAEEFKFWGATILILIPVLIVVKIVLYIIFSIFHTIVTKEKEDNFLTDELGRLIELKSTRNFNHVFTAGFLLSMASLVMNMPPSVMFIILLFSILVAFIIQDISRLYFHRKGI